MPCPAPADPAVTVINPPTSAVNATTETVLVRIMPPNLGAAIDSPALLFSYGNGRPKSGAYVGLVPGQAMLGEVNGDFDRPSLGAAPQAGGRRVGFPSLRRFEAGGDLHPLGHPGDAFVGGCPVLDGHL